MCASEPRFVLHGREGSYVKYGFDPQAVSYTHLYRDSSDSDYPAVGLEETQKKVNDYFKRKCIEQIWIHY